MGLNVFVCRADILGTMLSLLFAGGYKCECSPGWTGANCTVDVNECEGKQQPCLDDAQCDNLEGHFQCVCANGTVGQCAWVS